ncbi:D-aminoacyl-tRNA deacylase [Sulfolobus tengchongensis]|uniref:D-aminoacyl-tRNA deacylase n=1 Tax=Sulfolobus tengchongensis TaxID=207809 RepID=A0AAX4L4A5_9CREN
MDIRFIYSSLDPVGVTIKRLGYGFEEINEEVTDFRYDKGDTIIIFSRHQSKAGVPSLTVHYPGNPTEETMGGEPKKLGIAIPRLFVSILREVKKIDLDIEKVMEATHHGPTYQHVPVIFVEVGSDNNYWTNEKIIKALVEATLKGIDKMNYVECKSYVVGFGGPHYSKLFTKFADENCIGHVISKHYIDKLSDNVITQTITQSTDKIDKIVIDSLNSRQREKIVSVLRVFNINIEFR